MDLNHPDVWPRETDLGSQLATVLEWIDMEIRLAQLRGQSTNKMAMMQHTVITARDVLDKLNLISPLSAWRREHSASLLPLDNVYVCRKRDCTVDQEHLDRWGLRQP